MRGPRNFWGQVAAGHFPVVAPTDLDMWEAKALPERRAAEESPRWLGDYDDDIWFLSSNDSPVRFLEETKELVQQLMLDEGEQYQDFFLHVPTSSVRETPTSFAEGAGQEGKDEVVWHKHLELVALTHKAYDCPKTHDAQAVLKEREW